MYFSKIGKSSKIPSLCKWSSCIRMDNCTTVKDLDRLLSEISPSSLTAFCAVIINIPYVPSLLSLFAIS